MFMMLTQMRKLNLYWRIKVCIVSALLLPPTSSYASNSCVCLSSVAMSSPSVADVTFSDGLVSPFHFCWLRDNSIDVFDPSSGQRIRNVSSIPADIRPTSHRLLQREGGCFDAIEITWPDATASNFTGQWLRERAYDPTSLQASRDASRPRVFQPEKEYPKVRYEDVMAGDEGLHKWLRAIDEHGFCLVVEMPAGEPDEDGAVARLAERIGPISHSGLYGKTFHVRSAAKPVNFAYSSARIPPHLDLSYYESPPGLQYLHCRAFEAHGGDSVLLDAHAMAELLRRTHPVHFDALTTIPATFTKQRAAEELGQQASAASMEYRRPHIDLNEEGEVIRVIWSPPFMGPLRVKPSDVPRYYAAAQAFERLIEEDPERHTIRFRLEPGTTLTFNQRRLLHGREAFRGGKRHLEGTYTNIDDYKSKLQLLNAKLGSNTTSWRAMNGAF